MGKERLIEALNNCSINFDQRVIVTDLVEEYKLTPRDVNESLKEYIQQEEQKGIKFSKQYMVHGEESNNQREVYALANGDEQLEKWLTNLSNAETALYSVEIAGGAKAPAAILKPMKFCHVRIKNLSARVGANGYANDVDKPKSDADNKKSANHKLESNCEEANDQARVEKKPSPKTASVKGSINNFFGPSTSRDSESKAVNSKAVASASSSKKMDNFFKSLSPSEKAKQMETTASKSILKQLSPKKKNDFFKNGNKSPKKESPVNKKADTSKQLFSDSESSDEEEKLVALRKELNISDPEQSAPSTVKRRRIEDSDNEDSEPQKKHEKTDSAVNQVREVETVSQSFTDDEGYIITVKSKKVHTTSTVGEKKSAPPSKSPPKPSSAKPKSASQKSKQANIMNFFNKK